MKAHYQAMKTRHKVLLWLMVTTTAVISILVGYICYSYSVHPDSLPSSLSLKGILEIDTMLYFIPAYLSVWLFWFLGTKIVDWFNRKTVDDEIVP